MNCVRTMSRELYSVMSYTFLMRIETPTKQYKSDNNLVYSCQYHVIFCPKYRRTVLKGDVARRIRALILEKQEEYGYKVLDMEILSDHVHLLLDVNPKIGVFRIVNKIKGYTSRILRREFPELRSRLSAL